MVEKRPIDKLTIKGFKTLQDVELELGKLNVLIGPNGAGKSNFVSYFRMLHELVEGRLRRWTVKQVGADRVLTYGSKRTPELISQLAFGLNRYDFTLTPIADYFVFADERTSYGDAYARGFSLGSWHEESLLKTQLRPTNPRRSDWIYAAISNWKIYHFHDTSESAPVKLTGGLHDNQYLRHDARNLAAYLYMLRRDDESAYNQIVRILRLALPFLHDFVLEPEQVRPDEYSIQLRWQGKDSDEPFLASQLSDGSLRFICLVTALMQPDPPATIIIDEPEIGLHPYAITLLGSLLHSASERMQIIVATQSVAMVNQFSIGDLIVVELKAGSSVFKRHMESEYELWLEDYSVGELWEKNVLGGRLT
ncbi:MAG: AAA family ATPase [Chloroflexi bacterium]|nr:AAA family ATPase [Chloroflexota bacterium]